MKITVTEFRRHFGKYLDHASKEVIYLTKNGKVIAKISDPNAGATEKIAGMLRGYFPDDLDKKSLREERAQKYAICG